MARPSRCATTASRSMTWAGRCCPARSARCAPFTFTYAFGLHRVFFLARIAGFPRCTVRVPSYLVVFRCGALETALLRLASSTFSNSVPADSLARPARTISFAPRAQLSDRSTTTLVLFPRHRLAITTYSASENAADASPQRNIHTSMYLLRPIARLEQLFSVVSPSPLLRPAAAL
jgi:hypothetical protein